jgi:multicomponent Na+:H+ antiporter subunit B
MKKQRIARHRSFMTVLSLISVLAVVLPVFLSSKSWPVSSRNFLKEYGLIETGARNLVSAIYLGYRAFDTLGETIVLLVAVSGTIGIISHSGISLGRGYVREDGLSSTKKIQQIMKRTELLDVVTGKMGPIVLVFGLYVMMYGHLSPGGGFQGGVVIASGIVFLALGSKNESSIRLQEATVLARIEASAFLLLIIAALIGIPMGFGLFGNPLSSSEEFKVGYIIALNSIIGLKVGAGIGYLCVAMMGRET